VHSGQDFVDVLTVCAGGSLAAWLVVVAELVQASVAAPAEQSASAAVRFLARTSPS